ncbi:MAG: hypothetical protein ACOCP8_07735, partial [archaeon]
MFKKAINSEGFVIVGNKKSDKPFPIGFEYQIGDVICKVVKDISQGKDEMRRLSISDGHEEDVEISTIQKDINESNAKILNYGEVDNNDEEVDNNDEEVDN